MTEDLGPRRARRQRERLQRRRITMGVAAAVAVAVVAMLAASIWLPRTGSQPEPDPTPTATSRAGNQDTLLLVRHRGDEGPAQGLTLLVHDTDEEDALVLFLPTGTLVDIPGFGMDPLAAAYQYGGAALVEASVENLLGVDIDHVASVSNSGLAALLERTGGLEVTVDERLVQRRADGTAQVRFETGEQFLDGERLAELWRFRERGESELDTFPRQQAVWTHLLAAANDDQTGEALLADGLPQLETSADDDFLADLFGGLIEAAAGDELTYTVLPVTPFGGGDPAQATYRADGDAIAELTADELAGSVPVGGGARAVRVQILNGIGTPGIGQQVDRRLEGAGFRVVLTDNARSFDFDETVILVYSEDQRSMDAASEVQRRLGVGTIQVSRQPQSVVDLTIVVGSDFLAEAGDDDPSPESEEPTP